ncbi:hypothetical protein ACE6H2_026630 [Prunus campanulata]
MMGPIRKINHVMGPRNEIFLSVDDSEENEEANMSPSTGGMEKKKGGKRKLHDGSKECDFFSVDDSEENEEASVSPSTGDMEKKKGEKRKLHDGSDKKD